MQKVFETASQLISEAAPRLNFKHGDWTGQTKGEHPVNKGKYSVGEVVLANNSFITLFNLDKGDYDHIVSNLSRSLKPGEGLFRYESRATLMGGMSPLVIIDDQKPSVRFFKHDDQEDKVVPDSSTAPSKFITIDTKSLSPWTFK